MHLKVVVKRKQCQWFKRVVKDEIGQYRNIGQGRKMRYWVSIEQLPIMM